MRWEDERYVRLYTRDTPEWCALSFGARGLFCLILRVVDRAGILPLGKLGPKGVAVAVRAAWVDVEPLLAELLADGCATIQAEKLLIRNYMAAQEAIQTDAARKRASRERARAAFSGSATATDGAGHVTKPDATASRNGTAGTSHDVTESLAPVTSGHKKSPQSEPIRSEPSLDKPNGRAGVKSDETSPEAERAVANGPAPEKPETAFDMAQRLYAEAFRKRYRRDFMLTSFGRKGSDEYAFVNLARLAEAKGDAERWLRHWMRSYLRDDDRWLVKNAHAPRFLEDQLNKYGEPKKAKPPLEPKVEPPTLVRPVTILQPVNGVEPERAPSTPAELAEKSRAAKLAIAGFESRKP